MPDVPQVQYILCIRPNMENDPVLFEDEYVTQQLLSASIVEAAQVCAALCFDASPNQAPQMYWRTANLGKTYRGAMLPCRVLVCYA